MKAFPLLSKWDDEKLNGMDLRDYFAGQALAGILAHKDTIPDSWIASRAAYQIADNMMTVREIKND